MIASTYEFWDTQPHKQIIQTRLESGDMQPPEQMILLMNLGTDTQPPVKMILPRHESGDTQPPDQMILLTNLGTRRHLSK